MISMGLFGGALQAQAPTPVEVVHIRDARIEALSQAWREAPVERYGFRIQVFTGTLQDARVLRSQLRTQTPLPVYLTSLPPNYQILVGDFRDRWSAEKERDRWLAAYPSALVLPSTVGLPHGPVPSEETGSEVDE
jgi:hypothetical protein